MCIKTKNAKTPAAPVRVLPAMRKRRRNVVRFAVSDDDEQEFQKRQHSVMAYLPLSSEYSPSEKHVRWMSVQEKEETSRLATLEAKEYRQLDLQREQNHRQQQRRHHHAPSYRETYNAIFTACHNNHNKEKNADNDDNKSSLPVPPQAVALLAVQGIRGLEDRTIPLTALLRRKIRRGTIRQVVQASQQKQQYSPDQVAELYRTMSQPAARFARALGLADATSVLMEQYSSKVNASRPVAAVPKPNKKEQLQLVTTGVVEPTALKATV